MRSLRALAGMFLALGILLTGAIVAPTAATAATTAPTASPKQIKNWAQRPFFDRCGKKTGKFYERRFDYTVGAIFAGRCAAKKAKGVDLISSYGGHHPSATHAIDIMINMQGSCGANREAGNKVARYVMNHANKFRVEYIIWKNSYWNARERPTKWKNWRHGIAGGSCTTRHFDHVHVAFK